jgi:hypothetical protein
MSMPGFPRRVWQRLYADFLMPSRLAEYEDLLSTVLARGYVCTPIGEFWGLIQSGSVLADTRYFILRHDIDTDLGTARAMWEIEHRLRVRGSYYFRLGTVDVPLMRRIVAAGSEASYHYEELATIAKKRGLRDRRQVETAMPVVRALFAENLDALRSTSGLPLDVVASHGDFANRCLGIPNHALLADRSFREEVGVTLEVYDEEFMTHVTSRHSDTAHPAYWAPSSPLAAVDWDPHVVYVLVHPRYWRVNRTANALDDGKRLVDGLTYALRRVGA